MSTKQVKDNWNNLTENQKLSLIKKYIYSCLCACGYRVKCRVCGSQSKTHEDLPGHTIAESCSVFPSPLDRDMIEKALGISLAHISKSQRKISKKEETPAVDKKKDPKCDAKMERTPSTITKKKKDAKDPSSNKKKEKTPITREVELGQIRSKYTGDEVDDFTADNIFGLMDSFPHVFPVDKYPRFIGEKSRYTTLEDLKDVFYEVVF